MLALPASNAHATAPPVAQERRGVKKVGPAWGGLGGSCDGQKGRAVLTSHPSDSTDSVGIQAPDLSLIFQGFTLFPPLDAFSKQVLARVCR